MVQAVAVPEMVKTFVSLQGGDPQVKRSTKGTDTCVKVEELKLVELIMLLPVGPLMVMGNEFQILPSSMSNCR